MGINVKSQQNVDSPSVHDRLLEAGEELFCEKGFDATSVRDLAAAAECNIASVNYYFGGKENLYVEIWRKHLARMREARLGSIKKIMSAGDEPPDLEKLLRAFAEGFMGPLVDFHRQGRLAKLMGREMLDRHLPGNLYLEELIVPTMESFTEALYRICPKVDRSRAPLLIISFVGQLVHAMHFRAMMEGVQKEGILDFEGPEVLDHIVKFSAAGIRAFCQGSAE